MSDAKLPQRWDLVGEYDSYMSPIEEGDYVKVEDVEPLVAEITRLRAEVEEQARLLGMSGEREAKLLARVEKLEKVRAAARFLINEDAGVDDPAEDGWWEWEKNCEALRAALKEAKP